MEITDEINVELSKISKKGNINEQRILTEYKKLYERFSEDDGFLNADGDLMEKELSGYLILRLKGKYTVRQPVKSHEIIIVGMDSISEDKQKTLRSSLYVIDSDRKLKRISFSGDMCNELGDIMMFNKYKDVSLSDMSKGGGFMADERTEFLDFEEMTTLIDAPEKVVKLTGAKKIVLNDIYKSNERELAKNILSEVNDQGWSISTDWRAIRGQVTRLRSGSDETSGANWASFRIIDDTMPEEEIVNEQGEVVMPGIGVYTSPLVIGDITDYSKVWVLGTIGKSKKTGNINMNGFCVMPEWISPEI